MLPPSQTGTDLDADHGAVPLSEWKERHVRNLAALAEIGMNCARALERQATDETTAPTTCGDIGLSFTRISRAVRLTMMMEARLHEGVPTAEPTARTAPAAPAISATRAHRRDASHKKLITDVVELAIRAEARERGEDFDAEDLTSDLHERVETDFDTDFRRRSIAEVGEMICRDLGVPWDRRFWDDLRLERITRPRPALGALANARRRQAQSARPPLSSDDATLPRKRPPRCCCRRGR